VSKNGRQVMVQAHSNINQVSLKVSCSHNDIPERFLTWH